MSILLIIGLVFALYLRTLNYFYIIDDNVKRDGYMYEVPLTQPPQDMYFKKPSKMYRLFMISMHCVNVWIIYMLWGWCPALIFAVHPLSAWGVAWVTGNYYATTAYFCLISYFLLHTFPNIWGCLAAMPIFAAALNSTICCVTFPFMFFLLGNIWGCSLFIPLAIYLGGNRFLTGIKIRDSFKENKPMKMDMTYRRFFLMTKVMAQYTVDFFYPSKLGLFPAYGNDINDDQKVYDKWQSANLDFWLSFLLLASVFALGMYVSKIGTLWYFTVIAIHSQWRMTGQFYAQRYHYLAMVGLCVVVGVLIQSHPILATVVATALAFRTFLFIPAFQSIEALYRNDLDAFPDNPQCYNSLAQYYLNNNTKEKPLPAWRVNETAALLFKAETMDPKSWSIKMNVACFFASVGQWPACMQKTVESLTFVRPLGGLPQPVVILEQQVKNVANILDSQKAQVQANLVTHLEGDVTALIDLLDSQNNPALTSISERLRIVMAEIQIKRPELGFNLCMDLSSELNQLIGMIEKNKVVSDPDLIQIKAIVKAFLDKRKAIVKQQAAAISSPAPMPVIPEKVGERHG